MHLGRGHAGGDAQRHHPHSGRVVNRLARRRYGPARQELKVDDARSPHRCHRRRTAWRHPRQRSRGCRIPGDDSRAPSRTAQHSLVRHKCDRYFLTPSPLVRVVWASAVVITNALRVQCSSSRREDPMRSGSGRPIVIGWASEKRSTGPTRADRTPAVLIVPNTPSGHRGATVATRSRATRRAAACARRSLEVGDRLLDLRAWSRVANGDSRLRCRARRVRRLVGG